MGVFLILEVVALVPRPPVVLGTGREVEILLREGGIPEVLHHALRTLDRAQRLGERGGMRLLAAQEEANHVPDPRVIGMLQQAFVDQLGPQLGGYVGTQVSHDVARGLDVSGRPRYAGRVREDGSPLLQELPTMVRRGGQAPDPDFRRAS